MSTKHKLSYKNTLFSLSFCSCLSFSCGQKDTVYFVRPEPIQAASDSTPVNTPVPTDAAADSVLSQSTKPVPTSFPKPIPEPTSIPTEIPTSVPGPLPDISARFVAIGDQGTGDDNQYAVAAAIKKLCDSRGCDFGITLGDNFMPHGVSDVNDSLFKTHFELPYGPLGIEFYPILGNHDYKFFQDGNTDAQVEYTKKSKFWRMPAKYYKYSKGPIDFFALDTHEGTETSVAWLDNALKNSTSKYKIVYGHNPIYSGGYYENDSRTRDLYLNTLCKYDVNLYLSGHEHSQQVLDSGCKTKLVIEGTSGEHSGIPSQTAHTLWKNSELGFLYVTADAQGVVVEIHSVDSLMYKVNLE